MINDEPVQTSVYPYILLVHLLSFVYLLGIHAPDKPSTEDLTSAGASWRVFFFFFFTKIKTAPIKICPPHVPPTFDLIKSNSKFKCEARHHQRAPKLERECKATSPVGCYSPPWCVPWLHPTNDGRRVPCFMLHVPPSTLYHHVSGRSWHGALLLVAAESEKEKKKKSCRGTPRRCIFTTVALSRG